MLQSQSHFQEWKCKHVAFRLIRQTGTVEAGIEVDVLILSPNPIEDIANTKRIDAVISNGMIVDWSKIELDPIKGS